MTDTQVTPAHLPAPAAELPSKEIVGYASAAPERRAAPRYSINCWYAAD